MSRRYRGRVVWILLVLAFAACGGDSASEADPVGEGLPEVSFTLDFIPSGSHTGWYVAKEKGYFEDEGLDVEIHAGQSGAQALSTVISGRSEFAHSDFPSLALARTEDPSMNAAMVMATYARAPYAIYSLESRGNITSAEDLVGKTIHHAATSSLPKIAQAWATDQGLGRLDFKPTNPALLEEVMLEGETDAIAHFTIARRELEKIAADKGDELVTLELAEAGLDRFHGTGVVVDRAWAEENADLVEGFIRAGIRGFEYTFAHPQESAELMKGEFPTLPVEATLDRIIELEKLVTDDGTVTEIGTIDPGKAEASVALIVRGLSLPPLEATELYVDTYL